MDVLMNDQAIRGTNIEENQEIHQEGRMEVEQVEANPRDIDIENVDGDNLVDEANLDTNVETTNFVDEANLDKNHVVVEANQGVGFMSQVESDTRTNDDEADHGDLYGLNIEGDNIERGSVEANLNATNKGVEANPHDDEQGEIIALRMAFESLKKDVLRTKEIYAEELYNFGEDIGFDLKGLIEAAQNYHIVLEENRKLYNEVQDLKGLGVEHERGEPELKRTHGPGVSHVAEASPRPRADRTWPRSSVEDDRARPRPSPPPLGRGQPSA
nr:kinesin KP1 [Ipomoea batatas]